MDWVTPKELEAALIDKCGSRLSILNAICGRVEMDLLRVEADRLIVDGVVSSDASYLKRLFGLRDRLEGSWNMGDIGGTLNRNRHQFMKVQAFGVRFSKGDAEAMGAVFNDGIEPAIASTHQEPHPPARTIEKAKVGAKTDSRRWEQFAAALAILHDRGELEKVSESKAHGQVAAFLAERGHDDALSVDAVRGLIRRLRAWDKGAAFRDDADYSTEA